MTMNRTQTALAAEGVKSATASQLIANGSTLGKLKAGANRLTALRLP